MTDERIDPEQTMIELNAAATRVHKASNRLADLIKEFEGQPDEPLGIKLQYEMALDTALVEIYNDALTEERRVPAEDVRSALARQKVREDDPDLDAKYRRLETEIKAMRMWIAQQRDVISAKQSVLSATKALAGLG